MNQPLISIILPVQNVEPFLEECLNSIINQSHSNWELLAIENNSTDQSLTILKTYSAQETRIKLFNSSATPGLIPALQLGYANSSGEFITRMDADDIMPPEKLELLLEPLLKKGTGHVSTGLVQYFSENDLGDGFKKYEIWLNALTRKETNFSEIYKECVIPSPCWMMSKKDFELIRGFQNDLYPEDYDLCFRMYKHGLKVLGVKEILHHWRDHRERISRNDDHYSNQQFTPLKVKYFLELDHNPAKQLILWGAGKRAKALAKLLIEKKVYFDWVCDNQKKVGHDIYGIIMEDYKTIQPQDSQVLVAVSDVFQSEIKNYLNRISAEYYLFC